jgi:molecular chaperone GrpE
MDDVNDTPTTNAEPIEAARPQPEPEPELEIAFEDDQADALAALERKLGEEHDRLLRTAAELDNVRKRARRDVEDAAVRGRAEVLSELLPAIDAIDLALKNADEATPARAVIDGVEMVRRQFLGTMARFGLTPIACVGNPFDPTFHEAVAQIPHADLPTGAVIEELRRGYLLGERLLRASLVVVSSGAPAKPTEVEAGEEGREAAAATGEEGANG